MKRALLLAALLAAYPLLMLGYVAVQKLAPLLLWKAEIRGFVLDEDQRPVVDARVVAEYFGDRSADVIPGSRSPSITDAKGEFVLSVVPGPSTLFARRDGLGISMPLDLDPQDGQAIAGVMLRIEHGGRITGECRGADGEPLSGRWIAVEQAAYPHWWHEDRIANMRTDAAGEFVFERVPCGETRVMLGRLGKASDDGPFYPFEQEQLVTVEKGETVHVRFEVLPEKEAPQRRSR